MRKLIPGWVHNPGAHCASTVISDVCRFHGLDLDEPMCFGLGCGLGFFYLHADFLSPTHMTATRSRILEPRFFENTGKPFQWFQEPDPKKAMEDAKKFIDESIPLLLHADIAHLPHYNTKTHFPGHVIAMWGYDEEKKAALIADTGWEGLLEVPFQHLEKARYDGLSYMMNKGDYFPVEAWELPRPLSEIAAEAVLIQARDMMGLDLEMPGLFGIPAMKKAAENMPSWGRAKDWQWCARWFYQIIERRGTGGGAFRLLYARFLDQAGELNPRAAKAAPAKEMGEIASRWTELAYLLKEISEKQSPEGFDRAARLLTELAEKEERFFARAIELLS